MTFIKKSSHTEYIFLGLVFWLFLGLLSDFIEAIYAFCLLTTGLNETVAAVLLLLAPILLVGFKKKVPTVLILVFGELTVLFRIAETMSGPQGKMFLSGLGVGCFLLFFSSYLGLGDEKEIASRKGAFGGGLALAVVLSILLKSLNSSVDISSVDGYRWIGWMTALITAVLIPPMVRRYDVRERDEKTADTGTSKAGRVFGAVFGLMSVLTMIYFAFGSPSVIARWSGGDTTNIVVVLSVATIVFFLLLLTKADALLNLPRWVVVVWNLLFILSLVLLIVQQQVGFPSEASAYPVHASAGTSLTSVLLYLAILLFPVVFLDTAVFSGEILKSSVSARKLALCFTVACLFLLVLIFSHIFTTVYDYIPVIGPFFRDKFWLIYLVAGAGFFLPILRMDSRTPDGDKAVGEKPAVFALVAVMVLGAVGAVVGIQATGASPVGEDGGETLRVVTYNIQQGYDVDGRKNYDRQLKILRKMNPDVVGLQETDSCRIAGGNTDIARYYADALGMYSYNGPTPVVGTFGIVLLSKYPIENPRTFFMYSLGEQTATIEAQVRKGGRTFNVYVTHLGNDGDMVQQKAILERIQGKGNVVLMGDFNFKPDTPQYQVTTGSLNDAWLEKWPSGKDDKGVRPERDGYGRIDHIFVSPGTNIADARFQFGPQSDHPSLMADIGP